MFPDFSKLFMIHLSIIKIKLFQHMFFFQDGDSGGYMRMNQVTTGNGLHL